MDSKLGAYNIHDLRDMARRNLPRGVFEFVDRGTEDDNAVANNRAALERIRFRPRTLVDVSKRDLSITLFGKKQPMPFCVGPTGTAGLLWYGGELGVARAAAKAGIPFTVAVNSMTSMETIAEQAGGTLWFQLYLWSDRNYSYQIVERAKNVGFEALILTVDGAVPSNREYNHRNGFEVPIQFNARNVTDVLSRPRWLANVFLRQLIASGMPRFENYPPEVMDGLMARTLKKTILKNDSMSWDDLRKLRELWPRTLMVKGVLSPQDAAKAAECGADAVIVSNHGGRNLDYSIAPIDALPGVVEAAGKRLTVIMDSGLRRGSDVVKALALGAKAAFIGRAPLYGVAAHGEAGAARAIEIFREEIGRVMALLGVNSVAELDRRCLQLPEKQ
jgi:isopentenyl diphosphate isomerase/L-lactate dehydrogenase-like FMN-dependent dehydrogenase